MTKKELLDVINNLPDETVIYRVDENGEPFEINYLSMEYNNGIYKLLF